MTVAITTVSGPPARADAVSESALRILPGSRHPWGLSGTPVLIQDHESSNSGATLGVLCGSLFSLPALLPFLHPCCTD